MSMNFPNTPSNGDQTTIDGITYQFNNGKWNSISKRSLSKTVTTTGTIDLENASSFKINLDGDATSATVSFTDIPEGSNVWRLHVSPAESNWSVKNATYDNVSLTGQFSNSFYFKPDGTTLLGLTNFSVSKTTLSTPWDLGTAGSAFSANDPSNSDPYTSLFIKDDGTVMYLIGSSFGVKIDQFPLSTPWDVTTFGTRTEVQDQILDADGFYISPDGTKMYVVGWINDRVTQYNLTTPWDIGAVTVGSNISTPPNPAGIRFKPDGTKMFILSIDTTNKTVYEYDLSTPWDLTTAVLEPTGLILNNETTTPTDIHIKPDGSKLYVVADSQSEIFQYSLKYTPTITWTDSIIWEENTAPSFVAGEDAIIEFYSPDGGNTIYGVQVY